MEREQGMSANAYEIRRGTADLDLVKEILLVAACWDIEDRVALPPVAAVVDRPEVAVYHEGWGRWGDIAVAAERDGVAVGGAFCRLFTAESHGYGFVDEVTPEIAIAVFPGHRGSGLGGRLLSELDAAALDEGFDRLSLSVAKMNPARRLYRRHGYQIVKDDGFAYVMIKELGLQADERIAKTE